MQAFIKNKKNSILGIIFAATITGISLFFLSASRLNATTSVSDISLNVIPLQSKSSDITTSHIGYVTPIKSVSLIPNVSGYIQDIFVSGGQHVRYGDNLLLIDQRQYKASLDAAQADVTKAQADLNNADIYYRRIRKAGSKAVSQTDLDNAKAQYLSALGVLEAAKANRDKAQVMYDYTVLQASIDGTVGNVDLTVGNYVSPASSPLLSIIQTDPIRVVFSLPNKDYLEIKNRNRGQDFLNDQTITLKLANGKVYPLSGKFMYTDNAIDKSTGSISIYADFSNPDNELVSGAYVDVLLKRHIKDGIWVKQNHVYLTPQGAYIYIVKNNKLTKQSVNIISESAGEYLLSNTFDDETYLVLDKVNDSMLTKNVKIKISSAEDK
ncbi:MAG: efflux RND transporter periplasmic adaptor subunit [Alphaproteobacteria bacterium]|nr:efflux RND transporter periplasmic adaptor subunit [Alphaproteobacteria bacterium]